MDPKTLSSNWKTLQETLRKQNVSASTSTKRKSSDREPENATVKKRKAERPDERKKSDRPKLHFKKKKMSDGPAHGVEKAARDSTSKTSLRRNSTTTATTTNTVQRDGKVNEGRSPTLVYLPAPFLL